MRHTFQPIGCYNKVDWIGRRNVWSNDRSWYRYWSSWPWHRVRAALWNQHGTGNLLEWIGAWICLANQVAQGSQALLHLTSSVMFFHGGWAVCWILTSHSKLWCRYSSLIGHRAYSSKELLARTNEFFKLNRYLNSLKLNTSEED